VNSRNEPLGYFDAETCRLDRIVTLELGPISAIIEPMYRAEGAGATMNWYHYLACFFAGAFLTNVVPHFVHGVSGDRFPTPFATPPGKGLSSPTVNVIWAFANLVVGYLLFQVGRVSSGDVARLVLFFAGIVAIGIMGSVRFATKHAR
jgi:hypothetical protein